MKLFRMLSFAFLAAGYALSASAGGATRSWVAALGDDANPCSRTSPCKTFAGAISKTAAGGEINCVDNASYGTVTITKSITIDCTETFAAVLASETTGVNIDAASGMDFVTLRGLVIDGAMSGVYGVDVKNAGLSQLFIDRCTIMGFKGRGVQIENQFGLTNVVIHDSNIINNLNHGIGCLPTGTGGVRMSIDNTRVTGNDGWGIDIFTNSKVTIANSLFAHNTVGGVLVEDKTAECTVGTSTVAFNPTAVRSDAGTSRVFASVVTDNTTDAFTTANGGLVQTHQNNAIQGNSGNSGAAPIGPQ